MNVREKVLKEALKCVNGEREKQYGSPEDNFRRIADLWSTYLTSLFEDEKIVIDIDPIDVAKMMILFKIARSNGDKDKLDNYVDMIGYGACAAEIFENGEEHPTAQPCDHIEVAEECRNCDYAKKCMGTGVCLKDIEKKCLKDKPDYKCNRKDCGQFDACMTAYQHYICNKTKEASEAIDECMCENTCKSTIDEKANAFDQYGANVLLDKKDPYSYAHDKLANYVAIKAKEEHVPLDKLKDVNRKFPRELEEYLDKAATDCVANGKQFLDCYKEIDELFAKYVKSSPYRVKNKPDNKYDSWKAYSDISTHISIESYRANVHPFDVVDRLTKNGNSPTEMTDLLLAGRVNLDDIASYIEDTINKMKEEDEK